MRNHDRDRRKHQCHTHRCWPRRMNAGSRPGPPSTPRHRRRWCARSCTSGGSSTSNQSLSVVAGWPASRLPPCARRSPTAAYRGETASRCSGLQQRLRERVTGEQARRYERGADPCRHHQFGNVGRRLALTGSGQAFADPWTIRNLELNATNYRPRLGNGSKHTVFNHYSRVR